MMFADDVVLCARENDVLESELEPWREALEKRGMKVSRARTEYMCLIGTPATWSVKMQSAALSQIPLVSTLQGDGDINAGVNRRTCGEYNIQFVLLLSCRTVVQ